jgi:uncharacterized membrane protein YkvA (DUF1232 family)
MVEEKKDENTMDSKVTDSTLEKESEGIDEEKVKETEKMVQTWIDKKSESAPEKLINSVKLLSEMVRDYIKGDYKQVPWRMIAMIVAALIYIINPFDLIPDFIPGIGWLDDMAVIGLVISGISHDLKDYCLQKGIPLDKYGLS